MRMQRPVVDATIVFAAIQSTLLHGLKSGEAVKLIVKGQAFRAPAIRID
jgi:hypothetical protein